MEADITRRAVLSRNVGAIQLSRLRGRQVPQPPSLPQVRHRPPLRWDDVQRVPVPSTPALLPGQHAGVQVEVVADGPQRRTTPSTTSSFRISPASLPGTKGWLRRPPRGVTAPQLQVQGERHHPHPWSPS